MKFWATYHELFDAGKDDFGQKVLVSEDKPPPSDTAEFIFLEFTAAGVRAWWRDESG